MINLKHFFMLGLVLAAPVMGQDFNIELGITVEESYLQESIELMIIREQSRAETRDLKLNALLNIGEALQRGNKGEEILRALEYMALEGTVNKVSNASKVTGNYPDIRAKSAAYLGEFPEAKGILVKMMNAEYEALVLSEVVKSLAKVGSEDEKTVQIITRLFTRFDMLYPDNRLALACLEAYKQCAETGTLDAAAIQAVSRIAEGRYHGSIRAQAREFLASLRRYSPRH